MSLQLNILKLLPHLARANELMTTSTTMVMGKIIRYMHIDIWGFRAGRIWTALFVCPLSWEHHPVSIDSRIDIDETSIRCKRVGLMSNQCRSECLYYLGKGTWVSPTQSQWEVSHHTQRSPSLTVLDLYHWVDKRNHYRIWGMDK